MCARLIHKNSQFWLFKFLEIFMHIQPHLDRKLNSSDPSLSISSDALDLKEAILKITHGRPHATTAEYGHITSKASQTIRKNYCLTGQAFGITPIKIGNKLLWPVDQISRLLVKGDPK
jgi:hypothetical protein